MTNEFLLFPSSSCSSPTVINLKLGPVAANDIRQRQTAIGSQRSLTRSRQRSQSTPKLSNVSLARRLTPPVSTNPGSWKLLPPFFWFQPTLFTLSSREQKGYSWRDSFFFGCTPKGANGRFIESNDPTIAHHSLTWPLWCSIFSSFCCSRAKIDGLH